MGEGDGAGECQQPQGAGKGKEAAAGGAWPCPRLDFSLVETILDSDLQKSKVCCYKPGRLWRFRFSSHSKLTQSLNAREAFLMVVCSTLVGASVCFRVQTVFCALLHHRLSPHNLWGRRYTSYVCSKERISLKGGMHITPSASALGLHVTLKPTHACLEPSLVSACKEYMLNCK